MYKIQTEGTVPPKDASQPQILIQNANRYVASSRTLYIILSCCMISQLFFYKEWPFRPDRIFGVMALGWFLVSYISGRIDRLKIKALEYCMIVFTVLLCLSLIRGGAMDMVSQTQSIVILQVMNISLFPFLFYFVAKHLRYSREAVGPLTTCLALVGFYLGFTAICERFGLNELIWPSYITDPFFGAHYGRARGPLVNSVYQGMVLVFCIMNMLALWSVTKHALKKQLLAASIVLCMAGVYLTNTRGAWIGLAIAMTTTMLFKLRVRRMATIAFAIAIFGLLFYGASKFSLTEGTLFSKRQHTVVDREVNYIVALQMGIENPMFGIGWGRMGNEFGKYHRMVGSPEFGGWDGNHNEYLGIFAQVGVIALIFYVLILVGILRMIWLTYRQLPDQLEFERAFSVCTLGGFLCYMTMALFSDIHSSPLPNNLVFLLAGIVASISSWSRKGSETGEYLGQSPKLSNLLSSPRHSLS